MKVFSIICVLLLLLTALSKLPIGYYTFLRIVVTVGAAAVVITESDKGINFWAITFGLIAILFNPLIPIHFYEKGVWVPIDLISAILFAIRALITQQQPEQ